MSHPLINAIFIAVLAGAGLMSLVYLRQATRRILGNDKRK